VTPFALLCIIKAGLNLYDVRYPQRTVAPGHKYSAPQGLEVLAASYLAIKQAII
jgi:hypothetical protein